MNKVSGLLHEKLGIDWPFNLKMTASRIGFYLLLVLYPIGTLFSPPFAVGKLGIHVYMYTYHFIFCNYPQVWCGLVRPEEAARRILTDGHSNYEAR